MENNTLQEQENTNSGKTIAIISYLTFIGLIIAFVPVAQDIKKQ